MLHFYSVFDSYLTGGTLGLFTGMSLLSMIEVVFWMLKITGQSWKQDRKVVNK